MTLEADLAWRERFEADRRARGIPPEGLGNPNAVARPTKPKPKPDTKVVARTVRPKYVKHYPRTRISRTPAGTWVIDYLPAAGAVPERINRSFKWAKYAHLHAARIAVDGPPRKRSPQGTRCDPGTCRTCNHPMRHVRTKAADHPGTRLRMREGLCQTCAGRAKRNGPKRNEAAA